MPSHSLKCRKLVKLALIMYFKHEILKLNLRNNIATMNKLLAKLQKFKLGKSN